MTITQEDKERIASNIQVVTLGTVKGIKAIPSIVMRAGFDDADAITYTDLYPEFKDIIGKTLEPDYVIRHEGELYRVAQKTIASEIYLPGAEGTESIYTHIVIDPETGYEEWKQPTGAHDAYSEGDIVKHNGKLWISTMAGEHTNVYEPGVYGWDEYTGE